MLRTTAGQILVNDALPENLRDYNRTLGKKELRELLREVAKQHPEQYRDVSFKLNQLGRDAAQETGGMSFGLAHLAKSPASKRIRDAIEQRMDALDGDDALDDDAKRQKIVELTLQLGKSQQEDVFQEALAQGNPLATQVQSGTRGNKANLSSLLGSDVLYEDHRGEPIAMPIVRSFSEGLSPEEYWAAAFGARKGLVDVKFATADSGYLSKQLNQVTHRLVVVDRDGDGEPDLGRGYPVDVDDPDNEGALLARQVGPYRRDTPLTPRIVKHLGSLGLKRILVRSPIVGGAPDGGVYARDVGIRERGRLPSMGDLVGMQAAQALSEPLTQGQLGSKHGGGIAGEARAVGGFTAIDQQIQAPQRLQGGTTHAQRDGVVTKIEHAPGGGLHVHVDGEVHHLAADSAPRVKPGDRVEAGDSLGAGWPNPRDIVAHKGIGEGRRYLVKSLREAFQGAGMPVHRRNLELLAKGLINHVKLTDEFDVHVPDDVVPYSSLEARWQPREGHRRVAPREAAGKYLERPALHYTIGTKLRPSVLRDLEEFGIDQVDVHDDPPPFEPKMVRGMDSLRYDPDWLTRFYGGGLERSLLSAVHRGGVSDDAGTSFVPSLARSVDFGRVPGGAVSPGMELDLDDEAPATPETPMTATAPSVAATPPAAKSRWNPFAKAAEANPYASGLGDVAPKGKLNFGGGGLAGAAKAVSPTAWDTITGKGAAKPAAPRLQLPGLSQAAEPQAASAAGLANLSRRFPVNVPVSSTAPLAPTPSSAASPPAPEPAETPDSSGFAEPFEPAPPVPPEYISSPPASPYDPDVPAPTFSQSPVRATYEAYNATSALSPKLIQPVDRALGSALWRRPANWIGEIVGSQKLKNVLPIAAKGPVRALGSGFTGAMEGVGAGVGGGTALAAGQFLPEHLRDAATDTHQQAQAKRVERDAYLNEAVPANYRNFQHAENLARMGQNQSVLAGLFGEDAAKGTYGEIARAFESPHKFTGLIQPFMDMRMPFSDQSASEKLLGRNISQHGGMTWDKQRRKVEQISRTDPVEGERLRKQLADPTQSFNLSEVEQERRDQVEAFNAQQLQQRRARVDQARSLLPHVANSTQAVDLQGLQKFLQVRQATSLTDLSPEDQSQAQSLFTQPRAWQPGEREAAIQQLGLTLQRRGVEDGQSPLREYRPAVAQNAATYAAQTARRWFNDTTGNERFNAPAMESYGELPESAVPDYAFNAELKTLPRGFYTQQHAPPGAAEPERLRGREHLWSGVDPRIKALFDQQVQADPQLATQWSPTSHRQAVGQSEAAEPGPIASVASSGADEDTYQNRLRRLFRLAPRR